MAPYPVADKNERYLQHLGTGGSYAMSVNAYEKLGDERALEIFQLMHGDELARRLYAEGMSIPFDSSVTEGVEVKEGLKGWKEFAKIVSISTGGYKSASVDITGQKNAQSVFIEDVWSGNITVDDAISALNKTYNEGVKKYYEENPDKHLEDYINPNWNVKRD